jgi:hypothetical protein
VKKHDIQEANLRCLYGSKPTVEKEKENVDLKEVLIKVP